MKQTLFLLAIFLPCALFAQQIADTTFNPLISHPEYKAGKGPVVFIDEGHQNFHTASGRYSAFAQLLERDGYTVKGYEGQLERDRLSEGRILVIANALNELNTNDWFLPTPSAFTEAEIETTRQWVEDGGSLFLIADHMPMAGAATDLAAAFGFGFTNGFAVDTSARGPSFFYRNDSTLRESILTSGRSVEENVDHVVTFTGQAFRIPARAVPVLVFDSRYVNLLPDTAWVFDDKTRRYSAEGLSQGAFMEYGKGRICVFGEAAMFTAQLAGPQEIRVGMNSDFASENYRLLLNIIHWLDGRLNMNGRQNE